jgi:hypothetical protein
MIQEIRDRVTRIETRQLGIMTHLGMEHQGRKPEWLIQDDQGIVNIPSLGCSIKDILAAVPTTVPPIVYWRTILVMFKGQVVTQLQLPTGRSVAEKTLRRTS